MKKRFAVLLKTMFLFAIFSITFASAGNLPYNDYRFSTAPLENKYYYSDNYYTYSYQQYNYYPKYAIKYNAPTWTDYKVRSYGSGPQLVRFRIDDYCNDHGAHCQITYSNCHKTRYRTTCYS